jgi:hypothetical protein
VSAPKVLTQRAVYVCMTVAAVCAVVGWELGRKTTPARVEQVEVVKEVVKEIEVVKVVTQVKVVKAKTTNVDKEKETRIETKPDGTSVTTIVERDKTKIDERTVADLNQQIDDLKTKLAAKESEKKITTINAPNWAVDLQAGVSVPGLIGEKSVGLRLPGPVPDWVVVGASVQKRIGEVFGANLYGGVWGNSQGAAGLSVRVTF